ncbi:hypothetical protein PO124_28985 [Bacillus licheniformis]|nr:hypothetical protein [Bacillus licheniformis]
MGCAAIFKDVEVLADPDCPYYLMLKRCWILRMGAAGSDMLRGCIGYLLPDAHGSRQTNFTRQF